MEREVAMSLRLVVVYGSVRSARQGIRVARFVVNECRARGHEVTLVDPLDYPLPFLDKMYKEYPRGEAPEMLERLAALIVPADAVVVVSGEYNHSIPPALSNLLDHFLEEWSDSGSDCTAVPVFAHGVRPPTLGVPSLS
jgi:NAD(P)H-dependent FMN reductase